MNTDSFWKIFKPDVRRRMGDGQKTAATMTEAGSYVRLAGIRFPTAWFWRITGSLIVLNLVILLAYQHKLHGDFPFQDEWGYVNRLQHLQDMGFLHYLFDRHMAYHMPVLMLIWYLDYAWSHLNIVALRYTGAIITALVALLTCVLLRRKAPHNDTFTWVLILYAPFAVCSLNHWATYNQSIESVIQPLLIGMVLLTAWGAEGLFEKRRAIGWALLCLVPALIGVGTYASGLAILPAVVSAFLFLRRRISVAPILLALAGIVIIVWYVQTGHGLDQDGQSPGLNWQDLLYSLQVWIGLTGNAVFSATSPSTEGVAWVIGLAMLIMQAASFVYVLRLPAEQRRAYMVPLTLSAYSFIVFVEILFTRFHFTDLESTPRYSILLLTGPLSVLFYLALLPSGSRRLALFTTGMAALLVAGTFAADVQIARITDSFAGAMAAERRDLLSLNSDPDARQQQDMFLSPAMTPFVYPGRLYLEKHRLALYRNGAPIQHPDRTATLGAKIPEIAPDGVTSNVASCPHYVAVAVLENIGGKTGIRVPNNGSGPRVECTFNGQAGLSGSLVWGRNGGQLFGVPAHWKR